MSRAKQRQPQPSARQRLQVLIDATRKPCTTVVVTNPGIPQSMIDLGRATDLIEEALKEQPVTGVPMTAYEAELALGAFLLAADRMPESEARRLRIQLHHNARSHRGMAASDFMAAGIAVLNARLGDDT